MDHSSDQPPDQAHTALPVEMRRAIALYRQVAAAGTEQTGRLHIVIGEETRTSPAPATPVETRSYQDVAAEVAQSAPTGNGPEPQPAAPEAPPPDWLRLSRNTSHRHACSTGVDILPTPPGNIVRLG